MSLPPVTDQETPSSQDLTELDPAMLSAMGFSTFGMQSKPLSYQTKNQNKKQHKPNPQVPGATSSSSPSSIPDHSGVGSDPGSGPKAKRQKFTHKNGNSHSWRQGVAATVATGANGTPLRTRHSSTSTSGAGAGAVAVDGQEAARQMDGGQIEDGIDSADGEDVDKPAGIESRRNHASMDPLTERTNLEEGDGEAIASADQDESNAKNQPPASQRLENGDYAFFMDSFIEDPWEGMVARVLPKIQR